MQICSRVRIASFVHPFQVVDYSYLVVLQVHVLQVVHQIGGCALMPLGYVLHRFVLCNLALLFVVVPHFFFCALGLFVSSTALCACFRAQDFLGAKLRQLRWMQLTVMWTNVTKSRIVPIYKGYLAQQTEVDMRKYG